MDLLGPHPNANTPAAAGPSDPPPTAAASRRTLGALAIGAALGLVIAGFGLFTAKGTAAHGVPPDDAALVNQEPILMADYLAQLQAVFNVGLSQASPAQRRKVLNDMIREELYVQRGLELGMPSSDPDTRAALVAAVEQQVEADAATSIPSEAQLLTYYQQHLANYAGEGILSVKDLVSDANAEGSAAAAADDLRRGVNVAIVSKRYGLHDTGAVQGEDFYFAAKIHLGALLFDAATKLSSGDVSNPIRTPTGLHILVVSENRPPVPLRFDQAREKVLGDYRRMLGSRLEAGDARFLLKRADILIAPELR